MNEYEAHMDYQHLHHEVRSIERTTRTVKISDLEGKIVGIYFSANWYPPCHNFTPILANAYEQLKNYDPGFEIVFVSSDEDQNAFDEYRALMPWLAIPFSIWNQREL
ncbi:hypothetical protein DH2020_007422 [Rehmannia glutinosa]|uniref:protein-disulfide reductase n=1 Tax=Rehmannia glutinosa TaxID=99300 RepID=A0ABR0TY52_REHGL